MLGMNIPVWNLSFPLSKLGREYPRLRSGIHPEEELILVHLFSEGDAGYSFSPVYFHLALVSQNRFSCSKLAEHLYNPQS